MLENISLNYSLQVEKISKIKEGVYKIQAKEGSFILKKISKPLVKMEFVWAAMQYLPTQKFFKLPQIIPAFGANIPLDFQGDIYCSYQFLRGRKADFTKLSDLITCAATLADFHNAAKDFKHEGARESYFKRLDYCEKEILDLQKWKLLKGRSSDFFELYVKLLPYFILRAKESFNLMKKIGYDAIAKEAADSLAFIHGDIAARNFIIDNDTAYLIDFDYSRYDLHIVDLVRLFQRSLGLWCYDPKVFDEVLSAYSKIHYLSNAELCLIVALLNFPQRFWRLGKCYFENGLEAKSLLKLKNLEKMLPHEEKFLNYLKENYIKGVDYEK